MDVETRDRILHAAWEMFGIRGFAATTVNDVARQAFVTKGAVYHYYDSKEGLFRAVHAAVMDATSARASAGAGGDGDTLDLIQAGVAEFLDAVLEPITQRILAIDGPAVLGDGWESSDVAAEGMDDFRVYLAAAAANNELPAVDAEAMAFVIRGACFRAATAIAAAEDQAAAREYFGDAVRVLINGLATSKTVSLADLDVRDTESRKT
ncbi:MAG: TetR/AcrR family transcriptional regulator [Acidimicrobiales bacterium]|nr:TetR/AcrR family transcriptional regulator [Acidimicrobiales bacterium]